MKLLSIEKHSLQSAYDFLIKAFFFSSQPLKYGSNGWFLLPGYSTFSFHVLLHIKVPISRNKPSGINLSQFRFVEDTTLDLTRHTKIQTHCFLYKKRFFSIFYSLLKIRNKSKIQKKMIFSKPNQTGKGFLSCHQI